MVDLLGFEISDAIIQLIEAMLIAFLVTFMILYIYVGAAVMAIAKRTQTPQAWLAFIPIANVYLMAKTADLSGWYTTSLALAAIPFIGPYITTATLVFIWWRIAERLGRPGYWSVLMLIPMVNMVLLGIMAWGKELPATPETMPEIK